MEGAADQEALGVIKPPRFFELEQGAADGDGVQIAGLQEPDDPPRMLLLKYFYLVEAGSA